MKTHLMYTYKGKFYQAYKYWTFERAEAVLKRLGATYWEIGVPIATLEIPFS